MKQRKHYCFDPDYAVPPGHTLEEVMKALGLSQEKLEVMLDLPVASLRGVLNGENPITPEMADGLQPITGVPARFWNNLELRYRKQLRKPENIRTHTAREIVED